MDCLQLVSHKFKLAKWQLIICTTLSGHQKVWIKLTVCFINLTICIWNLNYELCSVNPHNEVYKAFSKQLRKFQKKTKGHLHMLKQAELASSPKALCGSLRSSMIHVTWALYKHTLATACAHPKRKSLTYNMTARNPSLLLVVFDWSFTSLVTSCALFTLWV